MADVAVEQLLEQIQRHLDSRQGGRRVNAVAPPHGDRFSTAVYDTLEEAGVVMDTIRVELALTPPHLPLVGRLWQAVRRQAHVLVVFYVNRLAGLQGVFNREIVATLATLVADLDRGGRADCADEVAVLRREVAALRDQLADLQALSPGQGAPSDRATR